MRDSLTFSGEALFPRDSIVNSSLDSEEGLFLRGPFEDIPEDAFVLPFEEGVDFDSHTDFKTIVSCGGIIAYDTSEFWVLPSEVYVIARVGGWDDDEVWAYQEIYCGGADILPDYISSQIASGLLTALGKTTADFVIEGRTIPRETVWRCAIIFGGGPTLVPW
jgi:hypothetical protein